MSAVVEEWTIPVPWGRIAGKSWGSPINPRVLAIHGLNDNAASFDQLIPHLHKHLFVVCMDLPGHGLSSHFPPGICFSLLDYICALKHVVDHFQWSQFRILAHSFGSHIAIYFTALFDHFVLQILMIDMYIGQIIPDDFVIERCQYMLDKIFRYESNEGKIYSYEGSLNKLCGDRVTALGRQSLMALQKRSFKKVEKGYILNTDRRLKLLQYPLITSNFHFNMVKGVQCDILVIASSEFQPFLSIMFTKSTLKFLCQSKGSKVRIVRVEGSHDIHMDNPENVAPIIEKFFLVHQSRL